MKFLRPTDVNTTCTLLYAIERRLMTMKAYELITRKGLESERYLSSTFYCDCHHVTGTLHTAYTIATTMHGGNQCSVTRLVRSTD